MVKGGNTKANELIHESGIAASGVKLLEQSQTLLSSKDPETTDSNPSTSGASENGATSPGGHDDQSKELPRTQNENGPAVSTAERAAPAFELTASNVLGSVPATKTVFRK